MSRTTLLAAVAIAVLGAAAAAYYGWGPSEGARENAAEDAAAREPLGGR